MERAPFPMFSGCIRSRLGDPALGRDGSLQGDVGAGALAAVTVGVPSTGAAGLGRVRVCVPSRLRSEGCPSSPVFPEGEIVHEKNGRSVLSSDCSLIHRSC